MPKKTGSKYDPSIKSSDSEVKNTPCLFCNGCFLESNEVWAACSACGKWAHCSCAGIDDKDEDATVLANFVSKNKFNYFQPHLVPQGTPSYLTEGA